MLDICKSELKMFHLQTCAWQNISLHYKAPVLKMLSGLMLFIREHPIEDLLILRVYHLFYHLTWPSDGSVEWEKNNV